MRVHWLRIPVASTVVPHLKRPNCFVDNKLTIRQYTVVVIFLYILICSAVLCRFYFISLIFLLLLFCTYYTVKRRYSPQKTNKTKGSRFDYRTPCCSDTTDTRFGVSAGDWECCVITGLVAAMNADNHAVHIYRVATKVSKYRIINKSSEAYYSLPMRLDLFVKLRCQISTKIVSLNVLPNLWHQRYQVYWSNNVNDINASLCISSP